MTQAIIGGLTSGAIYALLGLGIVLVFSVTRFVNLAQGEFYVYGALIAATLVEAGVPILAAAPVAILAVGVLAAVLDRLLFSRLTGAAHATQLLGGIGVALAMAGLARIVWGTEERSLPELLSGPAVEVFGARIGLQTLVLFGVLAACCVGLWFLLHRTSTGLRMRAVAALSTRAGILSINVRRVTTLSFAIAGALGAIAGVVITPLVFVTYQSGLLLTVYGFIAAAFGGLRSIRGAVLGGLLLGVFEALTAYLVSSSLKTPIALAVLVLILVYRSIREGSWAGMTTPSRSHRPASARPAKLPIAPRLSMLRRFGHARAATLGVLVIVAFALTGPSFLPPYWVSVWSFIGIFVIVGIGLDLLLGYTGQLSLGQTTFTGVAAYLVALSARWWDVSAWTAAVIAIVGTTAIAALLGSFLLRLRGFYFTLATLAVAIGAEALVNGLPTQLGGPSGLGVPTTLQIGSFELNTPERLYAATWIVVAICFGLALRLARSRFGQAMRVVGQDEELAAASAVPPFAVKLKVFLASSVLAAVAGVLYAHVLLYVSPPILGFTGGFDAVVGLLLGGFGTIWGALIGIPIIRLLPELASGFAEYQLLIYGGLVILLVLVMPQGVVGSLRRLRERLNQRGRDDVLSAPDEPDPPTDDLLRDASDEPPPPALVAEGLRKQFGGLLAVDDVDLSVRAGAILGLIGPNGAGKSTTLNLLAGSLSAGGGSIRLAGLDITRLPAEARAALGLARTFQLPRVPEDITVLDVAMLGAYRRGRVGLMRGWAGPTRDEQRSLAEAGEQALRTIGIGHLSGRPAATLSTGEQKMLELARAIAAAPSVLLVDEPAGGLAEDEVSRLARVLQRLAATGLAIVLVEHEMRLVMQVCDEIVVLDGGRVIGSGPPDAVRANQDVLDAYLGV